MGWDGNKLENLVDGVVVDCEIGWCFSYISFPILHQTKLLKPTPAYVYRLLSNPTCFTGR